MSQRANTLNYSVTSKSTANGNVTITLRANGTGPLTFALNSDNLTVVRSAVVLGSAAQYWTKPLSGTEMTTLNESLETILRTYQSARTEPFAAAHATVRVLKVGAGVRPSEPAESTISGSDNGQCGLGKLGGCAMDRAHGSRETVSTQQGVYGVWLFRKDMTGVYLTLNQAIHRTLQTSGHRGRSRIFAGKSKGNSEQSP